MNSEERPTQFVWRFISFQETFSPEKTKYIRIPIVAQNDSQRAYLHALAGLRREPDYMILKGCLVELIRKAASIAGELQGHLLDATGQPATPVTVATWLNIEESKAAQILLKFQELAIIEQVAFPSK